MERVSWVDAIEFCKQLSEFPKEKNVGRVYRLPTEAEWEYACRAGSTTAYSFGGSSDELGDYAWYTDNSGGRPHPVALKKPNAWGLHDVHGNVWEWCADHPTKANYLRQGQDDSYRVRRGGFEATSCRSAGRETNFSQYRNSYLNGFRVALSLLENPKRPS